MIKLFSLYFLFLFLPNIQSARILGVFQQFAPSHYVLASSYMKGLAEAGHHVTLVSPIEDQYVAKNGTFRSVVLRGLMEEYKELLKHVNFIARADRNSPLFHSYFVQSNVLSMTRKTLEHEDLKALLSESFDLVVMEEFLCEGLKGLVHHFKTPYVIFSPVGSNYWVNFKVANPEPLSYIPEIALAYTPKMTFTERCWNFIYYFPLRLLNLFMITRHNSLMHEYFPEAPNIFDMTYNASLVLLNSHVSFGSAKPKVPNMVEIGGFHIKPPKALPKDLQEFLDSATEGAIYFSLGSNIESKKLPEDKKQALLNTFKKLKQKVLWKFEDESLTGIPENLKISKWFPQQDILVHPNVKLFITHGGLLSITETIYHGVPVLVIPFFGDQMYNANNAEALGFGLKLKYKDLEEDIFLKKIEDLLENESYGRVAKERSILFHDRPMKPLDEAVYWTEYVLKYQGAPHLRVAGVDLKWYQYYSLDVLLFLIVIFIIIAKTGKKLYCKIKSKKGNFTTLEKKNK